MSLEVIYPKTNVIPYDKSLLQFHGTIEYDSWFSSEDRGSARMFNWYDKTDKPKHTEDV